MSTRRDLCRRSGVAHGVRGVVGLVQACKLTFSSYRLQPLGSYPRIADKKGSHDLFGPVNRLLCTAYDRAMVMYLACLKVTPRTLRAAAVRVSPRKQVPVRPCMGGQLVERHDPDDGGALTCVAAVRRGFSIGVPSAGVCRVCAWPGHGRAGAWEDAPGDALCNRWRQSGRPVHQVHVRKGMAPPPMPLRIHS